MLFVDDEIPHRGGLDYWSAQPDVLQGYSGSGGIPLQRVSDTVDGRVAQFQQRAHICQWTAITHQSADIYHVFILQDATARSGLSIVGK